LSILANEVTRVSLEVGTEGILGGQAFVPEVQGMWKVSGLWFYFGSEC
jgi:osomolarity two-component system sensor histidine kinase NIK1